MKQHYNYDDPLDGSIEKNSFNSIIKALDSYSNEYLFAYSDQFQDALLKKEVLDGLRFLSQKLQKTLRLVWRVHAKALISGSSKS